MKDCVCVCVLETLSAVYKPQDQSIFNLKLSIGGLGLTTKKADIFFPEQLLSRITRAHARVHTNTHERARAAPIATLLNDKTLGIV